MYLTSVSLRVLTTSYRRKVRQRGENMKRVDTMPFFETISEQAQIQAYENLAYELLDVYLENAMNSGDADQAEERLMSSLEADSRYHKLFTAWKDNN